VFGEIKLSPFTKKVITVIGFICRRDAMVENRLSLLSISIEAIGKYSLKVLSNDKGGGDHKWYKSKGIFFSLQFFRFYNFFIGPRPYKKQKRFERFKGIVA
jgi:hypothetical protein